MIIRSERTGPTLPRQATAWWWWRPDHQASSAGPGARGPNGTAAPALTEDHTATSTPHGSPASGSGRSRPRPVPASALRRLFQAAERKKRMRTRDATATATPDATVLSPSQEPGPVVRWPRSGAWARETRTILTCRASSTGLAMDATGSHECVLLRRTRAGPGSIASGARDADMAICHRFGARSTATQHGHLRAMTRSAAGSGQPQWPGTRRSHGRGGPWPLPRPPSPSRAVAMPVAGPAVTLLGLSATASEAKPA